MSWGHRCPTHGDRGPKPVEGRAASAHVGCCVWLWLSEQKNLTLSTYCTIDKYYYVCRGFLAGCAYVPLVLKEERGKCWPSPTKMLCWDQFCVGMTGLCWPKVPTFGCWADMSPTCWQHSQPRRSIRPLKRTTPIRLTRPMRLIRSTRLIRLMWLIRPKRLMKPRPTRLMRLTRPVRLKRPKLTRPTRPSRPT